MIQKRIYTTTGTSCLFERGKLKRVGSGDIIILFDKTPTPRRNTDVVCPHFYELKWATGCPYNCDWCYLKGTLRFRAWKWKDRRVTPKYKPRVKIEKAVKTFIECAKHPATLNTGELADSLMGENQKPPFSEFLMPLFEGTPHRVLWLSKGTNVRNFLENDWQKNTILSWSVNATEVAKRFEKGAPPPLKRLEAARQVYESGYEVRFRLDPMVPIPRWQDAYEEIIDAMFDGIKPTVVTLGSLRGLPATIAVAVRKEWAEYLTEKSNWGRKPATEIRFAMYSFAIQRMKKHGHKVGNIGVCKDTRQIHGMLEKKFGMVYRAMRCNCI